MSPGHGEGLRHAPNGASNAAALLGAVSPFTRLTLLASLSLGVMLTGGEDKTMRLWNLEAGQEVRRFEGHEGKVRAVAFSPDGKQAVSGCILGDNNLRIWDVQTGKEVRKYPLPTAPAQRRRDSHTRRPLR